MITPGVFIKKDDSLQELFPQRYPRFACLCRASFMSIAALKSLANRLFFWRPSNPTPVSFLQLQKAAIFLPGATPVTPRRFSLANGISVTFTRFF